MKLLKIATLTGALSMVATSAFAANPTLIQNSLADWVSLCAEILSFVCLAVFILYTGKYLNTTKGGSSDTAENVKVTNGVKNGIMTALVGIGICQAVIIVAQALFVRP